MIKKLLLIFFYLPLTMTAFAANYYTTSKNATLKQGTNASLNWTTNANGTTGLTAITATSADNFFVLSGALVTIEKTSATLEINNLTISGGANTVLQNNNDTAPNSSNGRFSILGSFKGSFKRLGAGNIIMSSSTVKDIDIQEVDGSSSEGGLHLAYGAKAKLTGNTTLYNRFSTLNTANLALNGFTLNVHFINCVGVRAITGGGTSSMHIGNRVANTGGSIFYIDDSVPGTTNYLTNLKIANQDGGTAFTSYAMFYGTLQVKHLVLGPNTTNSNYNILTTGTNGAQGGSLIIEETISSWGNGIRTYSNSMVTNSVTLLDGVVVTLPNNNAKAVVGVNGENNGVVNIGNNVKLNITEIVNPSAATNNTIVNGSVTGSFVLGTVPTSAQGKVTLSGSTSAITLAIRPATLPLDFKSFAYKSLNTGVLLSWSTANERNVEKFIIEKSSNGVDFVQILDRKSFGQGAFNYEFLDQTPSVGVNYYRLKGIDFDGKETEYPQVLAINYKLSNNVQVKVFPNPTAREINVSIPSEFGKTVDVSILDISGKTLHTEKLKLLQGLANHKLNNTQLPAGTYIIKVKGEQKSESLKVLVK